MESSIAAFLKRYLARELLPTVDTKRLGEAMKAEMRKKTRLHAPRFFIPIVTLQQLLAQRMLPASARGAAAALPPGMLAANRAPPPKQIPSFSMRFVGGTRPPQKLRQSH